MNYSIVFTKKALKELKKLDKYTASLITGWLRKILKVVQTLEYMEKD